MLGHAAPDIANALFDKMDFDKSGAVSMGCFVEIRRAIRLFVMQSGFQELVVESLAGLVYGHLSDKSPAEDGTSWAEQTLDTLTQLSAKEMRVELAPLYASLKEHGEQVKLDREARAKNLAKLEVDTAEGKFTQLPTAAYGDKDSFHQGLEVLGLPHPDVLTGMIAFSLATCGAFSVSSTAECMGIARPRAHVGVRGLILALDATLRTRPHGSHGPQQP